METNFYFCNMKRYEDFRPCGILLHDCASAIDDYRRAKGMTQEQLGKALGVKRAQVCKIEKGGNTSVKTLSAVYQALGLNVEVSARPALDRDALVFLVDDLVNAIYSYAQSEGMSERCAYESLDAQGRIDSFILGYDLTADNRL